MRFAISKAKKLCAIHLKDRQVLTIPKSIEDFLPTSDFVKTQIIYCFVASYHENRFLKCFYKRKSIPIGDTYKKELFEIIQQKKTVTFLKSS
jgi:hypothetical protein